MIRAAIAIGSNSTRSLVADTGKQLTVLHRGREETLLMMGINEQGELTQEAMERTVNAVDKLHREALEMQAVSVQLMATSATRDARNSAVFAGMLKEKTGLSLQIISGEEEATLAFRAAAGTKNCLVIDIGGGSTELTWGDRGEIRYVHSAQMGASRLLKMQPVQNTGDMEKALQLSRSAIKKPIDEILALGTPRTMTGLGGTCTTCAALLMQKEAHGEEVEGKTVTREQVRAFLHMLAPMTPEARANVPGLPLSRIHHIPHGLSILLSVMEEARIDAFTVSGRTNLDGYLLSFCE